MTPIDIEEHSGALQLAIDELRWQFDHLPLSPCERDHYRETILKLEVIIINLAHHRKHEETHP